MQTATIQRKNCSIASQFYQKFEYLAAQYANEIFNYERYSLEKEDLVQEMRIKLWTSIQSYAEKWAEYKETGKYKPVPIEFYLRSAMANKVKDFIRKFNLEAVENVDKISLQNSKFDYGEYNDMMSELDYQTNSFIVNGIDLLAGLVDSQRACFILFLRGFTIKELKRKFKRVFNAEEIITAQVAALQLQRLQLLDYRSHSFKVFYFED